MQRDRDSSAEEGDPPARKKHDHGDSRAAAKGHDHFGPTDPSVLATQRGVRATWISLGGLLATALYWLITKGGS